MAEEVKIKDDLKAIISFLDESKEDTKKIRDLADNMLPFAKKEDLLNLIVRCDKLLELYEYFEADVDVNGERVKKIAKYLKEKAIKENLDETWTKRMNKEERWNFDW